MATITGTSGSDSLYGTSGSDRINAGDGNDFLYYNLSANSAAGTADIYTGGAGIDMVVLQFTFEQWNNAANQLQLTNYFSWLSAVKKNSVGEISNGLSSDFTFTFGASTLKIQMMEQLGVMVDGQWLGDSEYAVYTRQAPIAHDDTVNINEESAAVLIDVLNGAGADSVPDLLSNLQLTGTGTAHGTVQLVQSNLSDPSSWKFQYAVDNAYYQYLAADVQTTDSFQYQLTDVNGKTSIATVTVTVEGVNDLATITNVATNQFIVTEDVTDNIAQGQMRISDADADESYFKSQSLTNGAYGTFTIDAEGNYRYTLDNTRAAVQALRGTDKQTEQFTIWSKDSSASQVLEFSVQGTNDKVEIGEPTNTQLKEDTNENIDNKLVVSGTLSITDTDAGEGGFKTEVGTTAENIGILSLQQDGSYTYEIDNDKVQYLGKDIERTETFTLTSIDGTTKQISFATKGINDAATIGGDTTGTVVEGGSSNAGGTPTATGTLTASDVDNPSNKFIAATDVGATYGKYSIDADGKWTYTLDNANTNVDALSVSSTSLIDNFIVKSIDGTEQSIAVTIKGADDNSQPIIEGLGRSANVAELINLDHFKTTPAVNTDIYYKAKYDFEHIRTGQFLVSDPDVADQITLQSTTAMGADYSGVFSASISGQKNGAGKYVVNWTYKVMDSEIDGLNNTADLSPAKTQKYSIVFSDGKDSISTEVSIKLFGENEVRFSQDGENNVFVGSSEYDLIFTSNKGNDILYLGDTYDVAEVGNDVVYAEQGDDYLIAVTGRTVLFGSSGDNFFLLESSSLKAQSYGYEGNDTFDFYDFSDSVANRERVSYSWGGSDSDTFEKFELSTNQTEDWVMDFDGRNVADGGDKIYYFDKYSDSSSINYQSHVWNLNSTKLIEKYANSSHPFLSEGATYYELRALSPSDNIEYSVFNLVGSNITLQGLLDNGNLAVLVLT